MGRWCSGSRRSETPDLIRLSLFCGEVGDSLAMRLKAQFSFHIAD